MGQRLDLQKILENTGAKKVYFQPPNGVKMEYPCIVYSRTSGDTQFADNLPYKFKKRYQVMIIDKSPDSALVDRVAMIPSAVYDRHYTADHLHHDVFNLYF